MPADLIEIEHWKRDGAPENNTYGLSHRRRCLVCRGRFDELIVFHNWDARPKVRAKICMGCIRTMLEVAARG